MMAFMDLKESKKLKEVLLLSAASFALSRLIIGNVLFTIPLLVLEQRFSSRKEALAPVGLLALAIYVTEFFKARGALASAEGRVLLLISLYIPTVLLIASAVWIAYADRPLFKRYISASLFGIVASLVMVAWFSRPSPVLNRIDEVFLQTFTNLFGPDSSSAMSDVALQRLYRSAVMSTGAMLAPMCMVLVGFTAFLAISWNRRFDETFTLAVSRWKIPEYLLWPFLGSWTVVLVLLMAKAGYLALALALQIALSLGVLYAVQGVAIIVHLLLKRNVVVKISKLVTFLFLLAFVVPGLNVLVIFALPLLGVTENWFTYRSYE
ncbi:MAG: DUF115 domain-containing protein [Sphaerochaeta sp.]|jgi:hypothetical protein